MFQYAITDDDESTDEEWSAVQRERGRRHMFLNQFRWRQAPRSVVEKSGTISVISNDGSSLVVELIAYNPRALGLFLRNLKTVIWIRPGGISSAQAEHVRYLIPLRLRQILGFRSTITITTMWHQVRAENFKDFNWKSVEHTLPPEQQFIETPILRN